MKYEIKLFGTGAKFHILPITKEQYSYLKKSKIDNIDILDICKYLETSIEQHKILQAPYWGDHSIVVYQDGIELWHSVFDIESEIRSEWVEKEPEHKFYLIVEYLCEGEFSNFTLELKDEFEPCKITKIIEEYGNLKDFVIGIKYDEKDITPTNIQKEISHIYYKLNLIKK